MKKTYVSPMMTEVNIEAAQMLAASLKIGNSEQTVDTSNGEQLGGGRRGEWADPAPTEPMLQVTLHIDSSR